MFKKIVTIIFYYLKKLRFRTFSDIIEMIVNDSKKSPKVAKKFYCAVCYYDTSKKYDYIKHLSTDKHQKHENDSKMVGKIGDLSQKVAQFKCTCGKVYKYDSGYYRHKKICDYKNEDVLKDVDAILLLVKQNNEFKEMLMEQNKTIIEICKEKTTLIQNTVNKTFNLNVFLNEQCKDAMNIMDFVDSLNLQLSDLENVGKRGFIDGISNIIVKNLKALDVNKRPVHCSDTKREIMYIKDEDKWEKENIEKTKLRKAIKHIAHKNSRLLTEYKKKYPDCIYSDSKQSDQYNKIIIEAMGGHGDNDDDKENKIIKQIAREVVIDK